MTDHIFEILSDGRVYVDYGPVSMVVMASNDGIIQTELCSEAARLIPDLLSEIAHSRPLLTQFSSTIELREGNLNGFGGLPLKMVEAVKQVQEPTLTPMATVAGTLADALADWIENQGVDKVLVNNGGDIAIRLQGNQSVKIGILPQVEIGKLEKTVTVRADDGVGGVCTSGLGGRSLTRGIANAVTVFSQRCSIADACATHLANASYIKSAAVTTRRAGDLIPDSDIADLEVVTRVGQLTPAEIERSLTQIKKESQHQFDLRNLKAVYADVGGHAIQWKP